MKRAGGIEGTPRAWQKGTEVARFFTAYDHNAIIDDFNSHKAESENRWIVDSGSNKDGHYVKFGDGTMIARKHWDDIMAVDISTNTPIYIKTLKWNYPKEFIDTPYVDTSASRVSGGYPWGGGAQSPQKSGVILLFFCYTDINTFKASAIAIGRWK